MSELMVCTVQGDSEGWYLNWDRPAPDREADVWFVHVSGVGVEIYVDIDVELNGITESDILERVSEEIEKVLERREAGE